MTANPALRPCLAIAASVLAFALLIDRAGFLVAVMSAVLVASRASRELSVREVLMFAVTVAGLMAALFVGLLDQPFILVPGF